MYIKRPILLAPTLAALLCPDSIHSPDIRQPFCPDSIHSPTFANHFSRTRYIRPTFANHFPRTRYIRHTIHSPAFAKMRLAFDTFARVIRHFGEFGASGHCLVLTKTCGKAYYLTPFGIHLMDLSLLIESVYNIYLINGHSLKKLLNLVLRLTDVC